MGSYPWGPHGPQAGPFDVRPNPTAPSAPVPQFNTPSWGAPLPAGGGATSGGVSYGTYAAGPPGPHRILSLLLVGTLWMFWVCLYPLTAAAGLLGVGVSAQALAALMAKGVIPRNALILLGAYVVGVAVVVVMSRIEYRLAQILPFRIIRHVVRLGIFGLMTTALLPLFYGTPEGNSATEYFTRFFSRPGNVGRVLANPVNLAIVLAVIVAMHFFLWKSGLNEFWHRRLSAIGLK